MICHIQTPALRRQRRSHTGVLTKPHARSHAKHSSSRTQKGYVAEDNNSFKQLDLYTFSYDRIAILCYRSSSCLLLLHH